MKILALEFSSQVRSVAAGDTAGDRRRAPGSAQETVARSIHTFALIDEALRQAGLEREEIECVAVGLGPGSYTGIRAAIAVAQGWQLAADIKTTGISSIECLAAQAQADGFRGRASFLVDAQRSEFYLACYEISEGQRRELEALRLATLAEVQARVSAGETVMGPEVSRWFAAATDLFPSAVRLWELSGRQTQFFPAGQLEPIYLRETSFVKAPPPRLSSR